MNKLNPKIRFIIFLIATFKPKPDNLIIAKADFPMGVARAIIMS